MIKSLMIEQSNKKTQLERKIKKPHLEWLASRISQLIGLHYTLSSLRSDLFQEFPEIGYISLSSMSRIMNGNLKMSYKKLGCSNTVADCPNYKEKIVKCLEVISWFKKNNYHIVYVDEFSVNRSTTSMYGWSKKGVSGWKYVIPQTFRMSFVIGLSKTRWEGLIGFKETINSKRFILFLKGIIQRNVSVEGLIRRRVCVICDNWSIHKSSEVQKFLKN